jgi:hypothetical protein
VGVRDDYVADWMVEPRSCEVEQTRSLQIVPTRVDEHARIARFDEEPIARDVVLVVDIGRVQPDSRRQLAKVDIVGEAQRPRTVAEAGTARGEEKDREQAPHGRNIESAALCSVNFVQPAIMMTIAESTRIASNHLSVEVSR